MWFKNVLMVWFGVSALISIYQASKGEQNVRITPIMLALSAVRNVGAIVGIWLFL